MAANNVNAYRVYGPATIQLGTSTNNALETLGTTREGAEIRIFQHRRDVFSDVGGPDTPVDRQDMGETARISVSLIAECEDVIRRMTLKSKAGNEKAAAYGDVTPRGRLIGTDGGLFRLFIPPMPQTNSTVWEDSWYFGTCDMETEPVYVKVGTVTTEVRLTFFAFPFIAGNVVKLSSLTTDAAYGKLYVRTNTATAPS